MKGFRERPVRMDGWMNGSQIEGSYELTFKKPMNTNLGHSGLLSVVLIKRNKVTRFKY